MENYPPFIVIIMLNIVLKRSHWVMMYRKWLKWDPEMGQSWKETLKWKSGYLWMQFLANGLHTAAQAWIRIWHSQQCPSHSCSPWPSSRPCQEVLLHIKAVITKSGPRETVSFKTTKLTQQREAEHLSRLDNDLWILLSVLLIFLIWWIYIDLGHCPKWGSVLSPFSCSYASTCILTMNWLSPNLSIWPMSSSPS